MIRLDREDIVKRDSDTVLIINNEDVVRAFLSDMVSSTGYQVADFSDPMTAIEYYRDNFKNVVMVFFDMAMPKLNGRETFFLLKKINRNIRSVALSGPEINDDIENIIKEGCLKYIEKPVCFKKLEDVLNDVLMRKHAVKRYNIESSLLDKIKDIPGSDLEEALIRSGGRTALFFKMISKFIESNEDSGARIRSMIEKEQTVDLAAYAHTIKNNSAALGLYSLEAAAEGVEKGAFSSHSFGINSAADQFEVIKHDLFNRLTLLLKSCNAESAVRSGISSNVSSEKLAEHLKELLECSGKNRPLKCFEIYETKLKNAVCQEFTTEDRERISDLMRKYEFTELAVHLKNVLERLQGRKK